MTLPDVFDGSTTGYAVINHCEHEAATPFLCTRSTRSRIITVALQH